MKALSILYTGLASGDTYVLICSINSFSLTILSLILSSFALSLIDFFSKIIILSVGSDFNLIIRFNLPILIPQSLIIRMYLLSLDVL